MTSPFAVEPKNADHLALATTTTTSPPGGRPRRQRWRVPTRLVDLPPITPPDGDLQPGIQGGDDRLPFRRLTPGAGRRWARIGGPYASRLQLQNCLRRHVTLTGYSTPTMRARLGPVVVEMELVTPLAAVHPTARRRLRRDALHLRRRARGPFASIAHLLLRDGLSGERCHRRRALEPGPPTSLWHQIASPL